MICVTMVVKENCFQLERHNLRVYQQIWNQLRTFIMNISAMIVSEIWSTKKIDIISSQPTLKIWPNHRYHTTHCDSDILLSFAVMATILKNYWYKMEHLSSNRNYYMLFWLSYLHLTLAHSKGQGQANCHWIYLVNGDR